MQTPIFVSALIVYTDVCSGTAREALVTDNGGRCTIKTCSHFQTSRSSISHRGRQKQESHFQPTTAVSAS